MGIELSSVRGGRGSWETRANTGIELSGIGGVRGVMGD